MGNSDDSGSGSGPYREAVTTRLTPQNYERYEHFAERESLSKSEALRQLIRSGLDDVEPDDEDSDTGTDHNTGDGLLILGGLLGAAVLLGIYSPGGNPDTWVVWFATGLLAAGTYLRFKP
jgi:hypothetical protein